MKVDKNIKITPRSKYPFNDMEIGDSFLIETDSNHYRKQASTLSLAKKWAIKNNPEAKFATRKVEKGVRIWRTK